MKRVKKRDFPLLQEKGCQPILVVDALIKWEIERRESLKKKKSVKLKD